MTAMNRGGGSNLGDETASRVTESLLPFPFSWFDWFADVRQQALDVVSPVPRALLEAGSGIEASLDVDKLAIISSHKKPCRSRLSIRRFRVDTVYLPVGLPSAS